MEVNFRNRREPVSISIKHLKDETLSRKASDVVCNRRNDCTNEDRAEIMRQVDEIIRMNGKRLWKNEVIEEMMGNRMVRDATGATYELNSGISAEEGSFLHDMIVQNKMSQTLEIGMAYGVSTSYILQGHQIVSDGSDNPSRRHVAIDPNQNTQWNAIGLYVV